MCERTQRPNFKKNPDVDAIEQMACSARSIHDVFRVQRMERAVYEIRSDMNFVNGDQPPVDDFATQEARDKVYREQFAEKGGI